MSWFDVVVLTIIAWGLTVAVFLVSQTCVGWFAGATVEEVSIGYGPVVLAKVIRGVSWKISVLPLGGYTKFLGEGDELDSGSDTEDDAKCVGKVRRHQVSLLGRVAVSLTGPLTQFSIGLICVAVPVWKGGDQVVVDRELPKRWEKNAVPYLTVAQRPSTWAGQKELFANTALEFGIHAMTFKSLKGWGGFIACLSTLGSAGMDSLAVWLSCFGVILIGIGAANLLPIPPLNGGHLVLHLTAAILGKVPEKFLVAATYFGMMFVLLQMGRIVLLDIAWF